MPNQQTTPNSPSHPPLDWSVIAAIAFMLGVALGIAGTLAVELHLEDMASRVEPGRSDK